MLDKTVHHRVEDVAWAALATQVQPAESRVVWSAMRQGDLKDKKVRIELFKGIKARRFARASEPEALLAFVRSAPESLVMDSLRKGVLQELQAYYEKLGDHRALGFVNAALASYGTNDFRNFAEVVFKRLGRQL